MKDAAHILVVDDDDRLRALLGRYLRGEGFAVTLAQDAQEARRMLGLFRFDLMVLDVMMPGESGLSLASSLRERTDTPPVLMLSALGASSDRVAGLEAGVDDYLSKPFEPKELSLRIQAILRRAGAEARAPSTTVRFGEYTFDLATQELSHQGSPVRLTSSEAALLTQLAEKAGTPVSREYLAERLGQGAQGGRGVDVQIARLRRKIAAADGSTHVQTVRGEGYVLQGNRT